MLAAEAMRLAAIEIVLPTAAVMSKSGYPTLAEELVYDSRAAAIEDLDRTAPYTPVLAFYTVESGVSLRGEHAAAGDTVADAVLEIVAELAVVASEGGEEFSDALAGDDPDARLVLAALCAQVRRLLERSQQGGLWRRIVKRIIKTEMQTFAAPQIGLRWHRVTIRMHCEIADDDFDMPVGGLPQPIASLFDVLPVQSYARAKLSALAAHFAPENLPDLEQVRVSTGPVTTGL
ncbi:hypothetical protein [Pararhizobium sp. O133]|uniref:hypothetical protein n=1 Tax=Pararhizobium sp. O133 TaxID=3449278 RepID=UPI003F687F7D